MQEPADAAQSAHVTDRERGGRIQDRLDALKISDRQFHDYSGIDRKTLRRAVAGDTTVRPNTYRTIEDWLDRLERRARGFEGIPSAHADEESEGQIVEFVIEGDFGVRVVVKGPVKDRADLEQSALRLMRQLRAERDETPE